MTPLEAGASATNDDLKTKLTNMTIIKTRAEKTKAKDVETEK